jgi:anti-anti-sigma factor
MGSVFQVGIDDDGRLYLSGELDCTTVPLMLSALGMLDGQAVGIDLEGLTFIDACALRSLAEVLAEHPAVRLENASGGVRRLLSIGSPERLRSA